MVQSEKQLPIFILREGSAFIAFSPVLDLSTSGSTPKQAKERFAEALTLFFEELEDQGTLKEVLEGLGWQLKLGQWQPPVFVEEEYSQMNLPYALAA